MGSVPQPRIAIASNGLGRAPAGHKLKTKFEAAAAAGFEGIELAWECLLYHSYGFKDESTNEAEALRAASRDVKLLAEQNSLVLVTLQPFMGYDALPQGSRLEERFQAALLWLDLCVIMGIPIMQVPTSLYPLRSADLDTDFDNLARNMTRLAEAAAPHNIVIGYEAPCWGVAVDDWQGIEKVIRLAGQPNLKHVLDTYHIAALIAGDSKNSNGDWLKDGSTALMQKDSDELARTLTADSIAYFQLSDAEPVDLSQKGYVAPDLDMPFHMVWSRNCRVFPYEGLLPVTPCIKAVLATGFCGWFSMEVFHTNLSSSSSNVPSDWARRGMESWRKVKKECGLP